MLSPPNKLQLELQCMKRTTGEHGQGLVTLPLLPRRTRIASPSLRPASISEGKGYLADFLSAHSTKRRNHTHHEHKKEEENSQKASVPPLTARISYSLVGSHAPTNIESLSPLHTTAAMLQDDKKDRTSLKSTLLSHIIQHASVPSCTGSSAQKSGGSNMQSSMEPFSRLQEPSATSHGDRKDLSKHSNTQSSSVFFRHVFLLVF